MIFIMEKMKNSTNTLINLYLMVMLLTCLWSLWKVIVLILMLIILHVMVNVLAKFLNLHILFKHILLFVVKLFIPVKWYVKEHIFQINSNYHYYVLQKNESNNKILYLRTIINGNVNVICYDSKGVVMSYL